MEVSPFTVLSRTHFPDFWFCCILCGSEEALIYKAINKPSEHWGVLSAILLFFSCEFFCWIVMTTASSQRHFMLLPITDYFYHLCLLIEALDITALDLCSIPSPITKPGDFSQYLVRDLEYGSITASIGNCEKIRSHSLIVNGIWCEIKVHEMEHLGHWMDVENRKIK